MSTSFEDAACTQKIPENDYLATIYCTILKLAKATERICLSESQSDKCSSCTCLKRTSSSTYLLDISMERYGLVLQRRQLWNLETQVLKCSYSDLQLRLPLLSRPSHPVILGISAVNPQQWHGANSPTS